MRMAMDKEGCIGATAPLPGGDHRNVQKRNLNHWEFHMPRFYFLRRALFVSVGLAAACMSLPTLADMPTAVTFTANSVWAQEVGNLTHSDDSLDYTVAVAAGKTLQLNLLSRNPNVFFKVKDQSQDKVVLDTGKTGESTW